MSNVVTGSGLMASRNLGLGVCGVIVVGVLYWFFTKDSDSESPNTKSSLKKQKKFDDHATETDASHTENLNENAAWAIDQVNLENPNLPRLKIPPKSDNLDTIREVESDLYHSPHCKTSELAFTEPTPLPNPNLRPFSQSSIDPTPTPSPCPSPPYEPILKFSTEGTLGNLTPDQASVLADLKTHINVVLMVKDSVYDDWYLLRFCRAKKFILPETVTMFEKFLEWRAEKQVSLLISKNFGDIKEFAAENWEHGYYSTSKDGYPVYIERYGKTDMKRLLGTFSEERLGDYFTNSYEVMIHCIWPECSKKAGRRVDSTISILDIQGFGVVSLMNKDTRAFMKVASDICENFYPASGSKLFIVNAGFQFRMAWKGLKSWLGAGMSEEVTVLDGKFMKELSKYIDVDQLPTSMGGTCEKGVTEAVGPWTGYVKECEEKGTYFADGVRQGDPWKEGARGVAK